MSEAVVLAGAAGPPQDTLWPVRLSGLGPGAVSVLPAHAMVPRSLLTDLLSSWLRGNMFLDRVKIDPSPNMLIVAKKNK